MSDITIPADEAKRLADYLRNFHFHGMSEEQDRLIALLDPPTPSLRDECIEALNDMPHIPYDDLDGAAVDAVLAVVRRHIEGLDRVGMDVAGDLAYLSDGDLIHRDDVLLLLGGDE